MKKRMMLHPGTLYEYLNVLSVLFVCACALPNLIISYRDLVVLFDANVVVNFIQDEPPIAFTYEHAFSRHVGT